MTSDYGDSDGGVLNEVTAEPARRASRTGRRVVRAALGAVGAVIALWGGIRVLNNETLYRRLSDNVVLGGYREAGLYGVKIKGVTYPPAEGTIAAIAWDEHWCFGHTQLVNSGKTWGWFILDLENGELKVIGDGGEFEREMRARSGMGLENLVSPGEVWSWREWSW